MSQSHTQASGKGHETLTRRGNDHLAAINSEGKVQSGHLTNITTQSTATNTKLDTFSGHSNNTTAIDQS